MAVKKRRGRPRKSASTTAKKTGAKRGRPRKSASTTAKKTGAKRGRPRKSASTTASKTGAKRGRPRKATATAPKKSTATSTAKKKTARKLKVGDCSGKLTRSRLVGGYALKKRVRKPKAVRRGRPPRRR